MYAGRIQYGLFFIAGGALAFLAACGGDDDDGSSGSGGGSATERCGTYTGQETCLCPGGGLGTRLCQSDGFYSECSGCPVPTMAGTGGAGWGGVSGAGMGGAGVSGGGAGAPAAAVCGNNMIEPPEQCDNLNLAANTCITRGYLGGGTLTCDPVSCTFNESGCLRQTMDAGTVDSGGLAGMGGGGGTAGAAGTAGAGGI